MGRSYNVTFHNARIAPRNYTKLITDDTLNSHPRRFRESSIGKGLLALESVRSYFSHESEDQIFLKTTGIELSGANFNEITSYSWEQDLLDLLRLCEPGAYMIDIDVEWGPGEQVLHLLVNENHIETIRGAVSFPGYDSLLNQADLMSDLREAVSQHSASSNVPVIVAARKLVNSYYSLPGISKAESA